MSFASDIALQKARVYGMRTTLDNGKRAYYYVQIDPVKEKAFLKAMKGTETFSLLDFGDIIEWGYGEPSEELKKLMKAKYKLN